jgi:hypothetical protein
MENSGSGMIEVERAARASFAEKGGIQPRA